MEYIVPRLIYGLQEEFNVLEIVPYKGIGEFRYYTDAFLDGTLSEYKEFMSEMLTVSTIEANDLTEADINKADLIIINTGNTKSRADALLKLYSETTKDTTNFYDVVYKPQDLLSLIRQKVMKLHIELMSM